MDKLFVLIVSVILDFVLFWLMDSFLIRDYMSLFGKIFMSIIWLPLIYIILKYMFLDDIDSGSGESPSDVSNF